MTFMHVFENLYASRINLNTKLSTRKTTYKVNVLTRNIEPMRHCTLPSMLKIPCFSNSQVKAAGDL